MQDRDETVLDLVTNSKYELTLLDAEDLVSRAESSVTGMAWAATWNRKRVWVTHMTTQQDKFIIELAS